MGRFIYCIDSGRNFADWAGIYIIVNELSCKMAWWIVSLLLMSWRRSHLFVEPTALPCRLSLWRSESSELIDITQLEICQVSLDSLLRAFLMLMGIDGLIRRYRSIWNIGLLRIRCPQIELVMLMCQIAWIVLLVDSAVWNNRIMALISWVEDLFWCVMLEILLFLDRFYL